MFNDLGVALRLSSEDFSDNSDSPTNSSSSRRVRFLDEIEWAMRYLKKDDRIVWYLSLIQRMCMKKLRDQPISKTRKMRRRIERKLHGFADERINRDFEFFNKDDWEHYHDLQCVSQSHTMNDYQFFRTLENKAIPKSTEQINEDFLQIEKKILSGTEERFCSDGQKFIECGKGWVWFKVKEGFSRQESLAMRHCGNGDGGFGEVLYSLREQVNRNDSVFWKPHLTFIVKNGFLGESKGFANQKPAEKYHPYIAIFLLESGVRGIHGGGYLPQNNFKFLDFEHSLQSKILSRYPDFIFDSVNRSGDEFISTGGGRSWQLIADDVFPVKASESVYPCQKSRSWLVLKETIFSAHGTHDHSLAWCSLSGGEISMIHYESTRIANSDIFALLKDERITSLSEDLLKAESQTGKILGENYINHLILIKPAFFKKSSLSKIFEKVGHSHALVAFINQRYGLDVDYSEDGIELENYHSLDEFGARTGIGSIQRKISSLDEGIRSDPFKCLSCKELDFFSLPWLTLRTVVKKDKENFSLHLNARYILHFFTTVVSEDGDLPTSVLREVIYSFGPPEVPQTIMS
jgi:hypothetical protein